MDKQEKVRFVENYIEQQKAYISVYTGQDLVDVCPSPPGTPSKQLRSSRDCDDEFGFDTPILRPRVGRLASSKPERNAQYNRRDNRNATDSVRKLYISGQRPESHSPTPGDKSDKGKPTKKKTTNCAPRSNKTTKASSPLYSDDEREARLAERRERKRKRRAILEEDDAVATAKSPRGSKGKNKKAKKASTLASLALLHGFSAANIKKNRLTLKSLPRLGVFNKGKASVKTKVASVIRRSASHNNGFSELAFLSKTRKRTNDENGHAKDSDDISLSSSSNRPTPKKSRINCLSVANERKESRTSDVGEPLCSEDAKSERWDIEIQSKCPSSTSGTRAHSDAQPAASLVMDLHTTNWFTSGTIARGTNNYPNGLKASPGGKAPIPRASTPVDSILADYVRLREDRDSSSLHPSHSASQAGWHQAHDCTAPLVSSKFFAQSDEFPLHNSMTCQLPQLVTETEVPAEETGNKSTCYSTFEALEYDSRIEPIAAQTDNRTMLPIDTVVGAPQPFDFRTPYDLPLLAQQASMITGGMSCLSSGNDILPALDWRPRQPSDISTYLSLENSGDLYDHGDDVFGDPSRIERAIRKSDPFTWSEIEHCNEPHGPFSGADEAFTDEQKVDYCDEPHGAPTSSRSFEDGDPYSSLGDDDDYYDECHPRVDANFLQGRTLLLGLSSDSQEVRSRNTTGQLEAEVEVANRLRNHWLPQKL